MKKSPQHRTGSDGEAGPRGQVPPHGSPGGQATSEPTIVPGSTLVLHPDDHRDLLASVATGSPNELYPTGVPALVIRQDPFGVVPKGEPLVLAPFTIPIVGEAVDRPSWADRRVPRG